LNREKEVVICPEGKVLKLWGIHQHSKQWVYGASVKDCGLCLKKMECTRDRARSVSYHIYEDSIDQVRQLHKTKGYRIAQKMRKRIEELFGEAKAFMGLDRAKFRRAKFLREQVLMTATAQNIKRMIKLLLKGGQSSGAMKAKHCPSLSLSHILMKVYVWLSQKFKTMQFFDRSHLATT
jgi:hypothetical protein